jgi:hypothetical protein
MTLVDRFRADHAECHEGEHRGDAGGVVGTALPSVVATARSSRSSCAHPGQTARWTAAVARSASSSASRA